MDTISDQDSQEAVIRRYSNMVYRLSFARTGNTSDAEDLYQEVFLRYLTKAPLFASEEHRKAWLLRTTLNLCRRVTQSSWRKKTVPLSQREDAPVLFQEPEENRVWQALCGLEEAYRLPLYLFYFQELSTREIARALSIRPGAVRMRLTRGREQLRQALKGDYFHDE